MKIRITFILSLSISIFMLAVPAFAQKRCSTEEAEKIRREKYKFLPSQKDFENWLEEKTKGKENKLNPFRITGEPVKIAVVVHVIYIEGDEYGVGTNISDEQIYSQIEVLNEDYQRKNADTVNTQSEFLDRVAGMNVEFVLARQTIDGNPTTGITRNQGPKTSYNPLSISDRELLSSISGWDPNVYVNIWVTNLSNSYIGLAQFPDYSYPGLIDEPNKENAATDGLVIDYKAFGSSAKEPGLDLMNVYNLGRTTTHEMGHFFGLKHVWGDNTSDCSIDDYVDDTPISIKDYQGESNPSSHESCGTNDMYENFLNYTNDSGMNAFTQEQVSRMEVIIENAPRRASLYNSVGTEYPDNLYLDLALTDILNPGTVVCDNEFDIVVEVKNNGTIPAARFDISYALDNIEQIYTYTGDTIFSGQTKQITLPAVSLSAGNYKLAVAAEILPGDVNSLNNSLNQVFAVDDQSDFIPLRQEFETTDIDAANWITINEDDQIGWVIERAPLLTDLNTSAYMNMYNYEDRQQLDWLISPSLDFSGAFEASVSFQTSYAKNEDYNDQLRVLVSKNCGADFDEVLDVYSSTDLENERSTENWEPEGQGDWTKRTLDLSAYAGEPQVRLAFVSVNDYGNNLYLDNIEFFTVAEENLVKTAQNSFTLYPNPSQGGAFQLAFNTSGRQDVNVTIYDELGKFISTETYPNTLNQTYYYDLSTLNSGVYIIRAQGDDFIRTKKLVVNK